MQSPNKKSSPGCIPKQRRNKYCENRGTSQQISGFECLLKENAEKARELEVQNCENRGTSQQISGFGRWLKENARESECKIAKTAEQAGNFEAGRQAPYSFGGSNVKLYLLPISI
jgi:hypothetical protein